MAETIIIDVRTNFTDTMSPAIEAAGRAMDKLEQSFQKMNRMMGSLNGNGKFQASFDLQDNASRQMDSIAAGVKRLSGISTIRFTVDLIDKVTQPLQSIISMATNAAENMGRTIISKGWTRVTELDAAKAKLSGLGNSVEDIQLISQNASDAVTGTAYTLNEAVTAAAAAVAAGMKPGEQLKQYLTDIADVAGISGRSMGEIGSIMNNVVTTGKAQNDTLKELAYRGLPIYTWLAKTLETSEESITEMAKKGEIGIDALQATIQENIAGAAQEMGDKTILGVIANINAAYGKLGEAIIGAASEQDTLAGQAHEFLLAYKTDLNTLKGPVAEIGKTLAGAVAQFRPQAIEMMDKAFAGLKGRLDALNSVMKSSDFQNAGLFGKLKIAWDTVIGDPLSEWWSSKGQPMVSDFWESKVKPMMTKGAQSLGNGIGEGLSAIIKGIFGWNAGSGEIVGEATSVGMGFAQGFLAGFDGSGVADAIANSLMRAISTVFSSLVNGGSGGNALLNALFLGVAGKGLFNVGLGARGAIRGIESLFGGGTSTLSSTIVSGASGVSVGSSVIRNAVDDGWGVTAEEWGPEPARTAIPTGKIIGGIAGWATAGVAVAGGIKDLVDAQKAETDAERRAATASGVVRFGGVGAGAAAGAAIGSILPGLGTLVGAGVGAGVGGLLGLFTGNAIKKNVADANRGLVSLTKGTKEYAQMADYASKRMATLSYTTEEVDSAVKSVYGNGSIFAKGNGNIQAGRAGVEQVITSANSVQGMQQQIMSGVSITDDEAAQHIANIKSVMHDSLESVNQFASGEFLNMQAAIENSEGDAKGIMMQAKTDFTDKTNRVRQTIMDDQNAFNQLVEQYDKGELTLEEFSSKSEKYVNEVVQAAQDFTSIGNAQKKLSDSLKPGGYSPEEMKELSEKFRGYDAESIEQNAAFQESQAELYANLYGAGSEQQLAVIEGNYNSTLKDQAQKRAESLGFMLQGMEEGFVKEAGEYLNAKDWFSVLGEFSDVFGNGHLLANAPGGTAWGAMETIVGRYDKQQYSDEEINNIKGMMGLANEYGVAIEGWVNDLQSDISDLNTRGLPIPEEMMKTYEEGVRILAASGDGSALIQQAANELAKDAMDKDSKYHDKALELIKDIIEGEEPYFKNPEFEKMMEEAIASSRYEKNIAEEGYDKLNATNGDKKVGETDKMTVYDAGGDPNKGYRYGVGKEKVDHSTDAADKMAEVAEYTVKQGDGWFAAARELFGKEPTWGDVDKLKEMNPELAQRGLNPGDKIVLSEGTGKPSQLDLARMEAEERQKLLHGQGETDFGAIREEVQNARLEEADSTMAGKPLFEKGSSKNAPDTFGEAVAETVGELANGIGDFVTNTVAPKLSEGVKDTKKFFSNAFVPKGGKDTTPEIESEQPTSGRNVGGMKTNPATGLIDFLGNPLGLNMTDITDKVNNYRNLPQETLQTERAPQVVQGVPDTEKTAPAWESATSAVDGFTSSVTGATSVLEAMAEIETPEAESGGAGVVEQETTRTGSADTNATPNVTIDGGAIEGQTSSQIGDAIGAGGIAGAAVGAATAQSAIYQAMAGLSVPSVTVVAPVTIQPDVHVNPVTVGVGATSGGTGSTNVTVGAVAQNASGGLVGSAQLSWLAEEGYPEMVIPFAPHRRGRALSLLAQAEEALGVSRHANGGIVGGMLPSTDGESGQGSGSTKNTGNVSVGGINFTINANGGDIVSQVQSRSAEITEIVTNALADALEQAYENTPLAAG